MKLKFWGTRGSIAVPGEDTLRYGGNTTCVELVIEGAPPVVIDAGTGIRPLGRELAARPDLRELVMLVTHLHWDHVMGFLFFAPVFIPGFEILVTGWPKAVQGLKSIFDTRQGDGHFPIHFDQLPARVGPCPRRKAPRFRLGETLVRTTPLNHPQGAVGFRFEQDHRALVFITDNELEGPGPLGLDDFARFVEGARVLVHDAQYLPREMERLRGYGHSDWSQVVKLARRAGVEHLVLTHHDPNRTDRDLDQLLVRARREAGPNLRVDAAREGMVLTL